MQRQTDTATTDTHVQLTAEYIAVRRQITRDSFLFFFLKLCVAILAITRRAFVLINWIGLLRTHLSSLDSGRQNWCFWLVWDLLFTRVK